MTGAASATGLLNLPFAGGGLTGGASGPAYSGGTNHINLTTGEFNLRAVGSNNLVVPMLIMAVAAWLIFKKK